jgi:adenosylcobinamide-phosphate synthase
VVAGALEVQLAGDTYYFGKLYPKKTIGDDIRPVEVDDIKRANDLLYITAALGMILCGGMKLLLLIISR